MINIAENGIITMAAGDSFSYPMFINAGNKLAPLRYTLTGEDRVYFVIGRPNQPFEHGEVRKIFTEEHNNEFGDVMIEIDHEDTRCLHPGTYYYEIRLSYNYEGKTYYCTIVPQRKFYII